MVENQVYVVCPVKDLTREGLRRLVIQERRRLDFLTDGLKQAESYIENRGKFPVLCVKPPRYREFIVGFTTKGMTMDKERTMVSLKTTCLNCEKA